MLINAATLSVLLLHIICAMGYANFVIDSEKELANRIDQYSDDNRDTYDFVARTIDGKIIVQVRHQDDSVGIEGFFTPTDAFLADIASGQETIIAATVAAGRTAEGSTLQQLRDYRYDPEGPEGQVKRRNCDNECNGSLLERAGSTCGQFCGGVSDCITLDCRHCYYSGGQSRWQRSCRRS